MDNENDDPTVLKRPESRADLMPRGGPADPRVSPYPTVRPPDNDPRLSAVAENRGEPDIATSFREAKGFSKQVNDFITKSLESFAEMAIERIADFLAPGTGMAIKILVKVVGIVEALTEGSGEVSVPVASFGGLDFNISVQIGGADHDFPGTFISPAEDGPIFEEIDLEPERDNNQTALVQANLSWLSDLDPNDRPRAMHAYCKREVLPWLGKEYQQKFELIYVYDYRTGAGAWMHATDENEEWCLLFWVKANHSKAGNRSGGLK